MAKRLQQCVKVGKDANGRSIYKTVHGLTQQELYEKAAAEMALPPLSKSLGNCLTSKKLCDILLLAFE